MIAVAIEGNGPSGTDYPLLKQHTDTGAVVLFTGPLTGVLLSPDASVPIGRHSQVWTEKMYVPFNGSITLSNEK